MDVHSISFPRSSACPKRGKEGGGGGNSTRDTRSTELPKVPAVRKGRKKFNILLLAPRLSGQPDQCIQHKQPGYPLPKRIGPCMAASKCSKVSVGKEAEIRRSTKR